MMTLNNFGLLTYGKVIILSCVSITEHKIYITSNVAFLGSTESAGSRISVGPDKASPSGTKLSPLFDLDISHFLEKHLGSLF